MYHFLNTLRLRATVESLYRIRGCSVFIDFVCTLQVHLSNKLKKLSDVKYWFG